MIRLGLFLSELSQVKQGSQKAVKYTNGIQGVLFLFNSSLIFRVALS